MRAEIEGRPLLAASLALIAGISTAWHPANALFLVLLLGLVFRNLLTASWVAVAFLIGLLIAPPQLLGSQTHAGTWSGNGTVVSVPALTASGSVCEMETEQGRVTLLARGRNDLAFGQTLQVSGRVLPPHGEQGQRALLQNELAAISCKQGDIRILQSGPGWFELSGTWRNSFIKGVRGSVDEQEASLIDALCFSVTAPLDTPTKAELDRVGVVHILSVSGLQVFLFAFLVQYLLSLVPISRPFQLLILAVVLAFYASASGLHASTLRSVLMAMLAMSAYLVRRESDFLSALGLAAIVTVLWQPWSIYTPSFQLSYVTVATLSLYWKPFWAAGSRKAVDVVASRVWFLLRASLVATVATAPLTAYHFGEVPLVSPITNLLIAPALPVIVLVAIISWPIGLAVPALQVGLLQAGVRPLADWIIFLGDTFGRQGWAAMQTPSFNPYWMALYYGDLTPF